MQPPKKSEALIAKQKELKQAAVEQRKAIGKMMKESGFDDYRTLEFSVADLLAVSPNA